MRSKQAVCVRPCQASLLRRTRRGDAFIRTMWGKEREDEAALPAPSSLRAGASYDLPIVLSRRLVGRGTRLGKLARASHRGTEGNHHRLHCFSPPVARARPSRLQSERRDTWITIWMLFRARQVGEGTQMRANLCDCAGERTLIYSAATGMIRCEGSHAASKVPALAICQAVAKRSSLLPRNNSPGSRNRYCSAKVTTRSGAARRMK